MNTFSETVHSDFSRGELEIVFEDLDRVGNDQNYQNVWTKSAVSWTTHIHGTATHRNRETGTFVLGSEQSALQHPASGTLTNETTVSEKGLQQNQRTSNACYRQEHSDIGVRIQWATVAVCLHCEALFERKPIFSATRESRQIENVSTRLTL